MAYLLFTVSVTFTPSEVQLLHSSYNTDNIAIISISKLENTKQNKTSKTTSQPPQCISLFYASETNHELHIPNGKTALSALIAQSLIALSALMAVNSQISHGSQCSHWHLVESFSAKVIKFLHYLQQVHFVCIIFVHVQQVYTI